ncbi:MAG: protein-tyrosine-phosphatase [Chloroflexota bacterium]|nr:protein-tyrosine-phosphatase [Chloroflexota bacterium]
MPHSLDPPLRIDWLAANELGGGAGRLGLTFLPGKRGPSLRYPGRTYRRELATDLTTLRDAGVRYLLLLVEDDELARWGDPEIVSRAESVGVRVDRRPLRDGSAPPSMAAMDDLVETLESARRTGDVAVACMGGVGRTGTVAACALVARGLSAADAIDRVRAVRHPTAVETPEQVAFVEAYEGHVEQRIGADTVAP